MAEVAQITAKRIRMATPDMLGAVLQRQKAPLHELAPRDTGFNLNRSQGPPHGAWHYIERTGAPVRRVSIRHTGRNSDEGTL